MIIGKTITVGKAEFNKIKVFGSLLLRCKQTGDEIFFAPRIHDNAVIEQGVSPHCPTCGSGEYMTNDDGNDNDYCGQCGTKLIREE